MPGIYNYSMAESLRITLYKYEHLPHLTFQTVICDVFSFLFTFKQKTVGQNHLSTFLLTEEDIKFFFNFFLSSLIPKQNKNIDLVGEIITLLLVKDIENFSKSICKTEKYFSSRIVNHYDFYMCLRIDFSNATSPETRGEIRLLHVYF